MVLNLGRMKAVFILSKTTFLAFASQGPQHPGSGWGESFTRSQFMEHLATEASAGQNICPYHVARSCLHHLDSWEWGGKGPTVGNSSTIRPQASHRTYFFNCNRKIIHTSLVQVADFFFFNDRSIGGICGEICNVKESMSSPSCNSLLFPLTDLVLCMCICVPVSVIFMYLDYTFYLVLCSPVWPATP